MQWHKAYCSVLPYRLLARWDGKHKDPIRRVLGDAVSWGSSVFKSRTEGHDSTYFYCSFENRWYPKGTNILTNGVGFSFMSDKWLAQKLMKIDNMYFYKDDFEEVLWSQLSNSSFIEFAQWLKKHKLLDIGRYDSKTRQVVPVSPDGPGELVVRADKGTRLRPFRTGMIAVLNIKGNGLSKYAHSPVLSIKEFVGIFSNSSDAKIRQPNCPILYFQDLVHWLPENDFLRSSYENRREVWRGVECFTGEPPKPEFGDVIK